MKSNILPISELKLEAADWVQKNAIVEMRLSLNGMLLLGVIETRAANGFPNGHIRLAGYTPRLMPLGPFSPGVRFTLETGTAMLVLAFDLKTVMSYNRLGDPQKIAEAALANLQAHAHPTPLTVRNGTPEECLQLIQAIVDIAEQPMEIAFGEKPTWDWDFWPGKVNAILDAILAWHHPRQDEPYMPKGLKIERRATKRMFVNAEQATGHQRLAAFGLIEGFLERVRAEPADVFKKARKAFRDLSL